MSRLPVTFFIQLGSCLIPTTVKEHTRLSVVILKLGYSQTFAQCNFKMQCGKCLVHIDGFEEAEYDEEKFILNLGHANEGVRCACQVRVSTLLEDKVVRLL